jgi:type IV pilus assembly protein PilB
MLKRRRPVDIAAPTYHSEVVPPIGAALHATRRLGEILIEQGAVNPWEFEDALEEQVRLGGKIGTTLVRRGVITSRALTEALSAQFGIPILDVRLERAMPEALALIDESIARLLVVVPMSTDGTTARVAVADPLDDRLQELLSGLAVSRVNVVLADADDIRTTLNDSYKALSTVDEQIRQFEASVPLPPPQTESRLAFAEADAPIVNVVDGIVSQALRDRASDVHIEPTDGRLRVRFRIDGALTEVLSLPSSMSNALVSRIKIMADMNIVERRRPQDGQFQATVDGRDVDVRVATTSTIWGEKAVLRLLDKSRSLLPLAQLGMPGSTYDVFSKIVHQPYGMIICSGPTGSGKTTTLYATLAEISRTELNVMTIEDPVEYVFPQINQTQINIQADVTFAVGLRSILRQDPDIILVGEIRDAETARIAVQSALTGHVVMSSLHATDSASALFRLLDMGIEPFLVSSAVVGVVAQRLVRRVCPSCTVDYTPTESELAWYAHVFGPPKASFVHGTGCNYCANTGFRERIGVYEVLEVSDEIRHLVTTGASPRDVRRLAVDQGMSSLGNAAAQLVHRDLTTIDECIRNVYVP